MATTLEEQCIAPSKWLIEGWDVRRFVDHSGWYAVASSEAFVRDTLAEVREEIADRIDSYRH